MSVQQTWEVHESWRHWSEFLHEEDLEYSKRYHYRVCWSIPTRRKPIPQATASVFFVIEISKVKPAVSTQKWHQSFKGQEYRGQGRGAGKCQFAERPSRSKQLSQELLTRPGHCQSNGSRFERGVGRQREQSVEPEAGSVPKTWRLAET